MLCWDLVGEGLRGYVNIPIAIPWGADREGEIQEPSAKALGSFGAEKVIYLK